MSSIQFDGTEILTSDYIPQFVKHESVATRTLGSIALARQDGEVAIFERYGRKTISLKGTLRASTQDDLDGAIDDFKELFSRPEKNLDISWNGGTRRYVATCTRHEFDRDHYHTNGVPWTAEFTVASGIGYDTETTTPIDADSISTADDGDGNFIYEGSFTIDGSKAAAPIITLEFTSADSDMLGIEFMNTDTNERIIVTRNGTWDGATVVIDCFNKRVLDNVADHSLDLAEGNFYGLFPSWKIGTNNFKITTGGIVNQQSSDTTIPAPGPFLSFTDTDVRHAISFTVPYADDTFGQYALGIEKTGTLSDKIECLICDDNSGEPDTGSVVDIGYVYAADMTTSPAYVLSDFTGANSLSPNTRYWLVLIPFEGDGSNHYDLYADSSGVITYPRGTPAHSDDAGGTWDTADLTYMSFRIMFGGEANATDIDLTVEYTKTYL